MCEKHSANRQQRRNITEKQALYGEITGMENLTAKIAEILKNSSVSNYRREAQWLVEESSSEQAAWENALRRAAGEPLQYVLGTAPFRDLMLKSDPRALIPRPETETLAQWIIDRTPAGGKVLDLGTGSGAIALAVATERPDTMVTAADISPDALALAQENALLCGAENVSFIRSDLFSALENHRFDTIGANLPYVTEDEYAGLSPEVRDFEPVLALTAPENGLLLIRRTIENISNHLNPGGGAIFELSPHQAPQTAAMLEQAGLTAEIVKDLCGRDRFVTGELQ